MHQSRRLRRGDASCSPNEPPPLSIAVLPFDNLSGDPEQAYLADGIAEDLTTDLVHLAGAFVIARELAFRSAARPSIFATSVASSACAMWSRVACVRSVRACGSTHSWSRRRAGAHVWAERFDKPIASLGEGQDDIVEHLAFRTRRQTGQSR